MIAVVDSGVANLTSVVAALHRLSAEAVVTSDPDQIARADRVILPGVGAAAAAMARLNARGLDACLPALTQPVLGICLGMQLLFTRSEENGGTAGLGVLEGTVRSLATTPDRIVPHMGWNTLKIAIPHPLLRGVDDESHVYFVHSYAAEVGTETLATCDYGHAFSAVVGRGNFFGCQFHPERSSAVGAQILKNFLSL